MKIFGPWNLRLVASLTCLNQMGTAHAIAAACAELLRWRQQAVVGSGYE